MEKLNFDGEKIEKFDDDSLVAAELGAQGLKSVAEEEIALARENEKQMALETMQAAKKKCVETRQKFWEVMENSGGKIEQKRFEFWERIYKNSFDDMNRAAADAGAPENTQEYFDLVEWKDGQFSGDPEKTLESAAGDFYQERVEDLRLAIIDSEDEKKDEDFKILKGLHNVAMTYFDRIYMTNNDGGMSLQEAKLLDNSRTMAHNNLIKYFNQVNDLARKYGQKPLTMRNFITSEANQSNDRSGGMRTRMSFDRNIVAEYCRKAFSQEVKRYEQAQSSDLWRFR